MICSEVCSSCVYTFGTFRPYGASRRWKTPFHLTRICSEVRSSCVCNTVLVVFWGERGGHMLTSVFSSSDFWERDCLLRRVLVPDDDKIKIMKCGTVCAGCPASEDQWAAVAGCCKTKTKPTGNFSSESLELDEVNRWHSTLRLDSEHVKDADQETQRCEADRDTTATAEEGWRRHRRRKIVAMHHVQLYDHRGVPEEAHPLQPFDLKR